MKKKHWFLLFLHLLSFNFISEAVQYPIINFSPSDYNGGIQNIDFAQNRDQSIFVANNLGVLSFNGNEWNIHARNTGKKQRSLAFDAENNRLYVGSQGDFGYFSEDWKYTSLGEKLSADAPEFDEVWSVFLQDSKVYFCTFQAIFIYDKNFEIITSTTKLGYTFKVGNRIFTQSSEGRILEVRGNDLIAGMQQGIENSSVAGILENDGGIIIFYNSGRIENSTQQKAEPIYQKLSNLIKGTYVNHVVELSDGKIVVSTQRAGVFIFDPNLDSVENIGVNNGLQSNACLKSFQDKDGNLWVGMQNGLAVVTLNSPIRKINANSGVQGSGYDALETKEAIYYSTSNGVFHYDKKSDNTTFVRGTEGPSYSIQQIRGAIYLSHHTGLFVLKNHQATRIIKLNGIWKLLPLRQHPNYVIAGTYEGLYLFEIKGDQSLAPVGSIDGFNESSRFLEEDKEGYLWVSQFYKGIYRLSLEDDLKNVQVEKMADSERLNLNEHVFLSTVDDKIYFSTEKGVYVYDEDKKKITRSDLFNDILGDDWVYLFTQDKNKNVHVFTENRVGYFKKIGPANYGFVPSSLYSLRQSFNNDLLNIATQLEQKILFNANNGFIAYEPEKEDRLQQSKRPTLLYVQNTTDSTFFYQQSAFADRQDETVQISFKERIPTIRFKVQSFQFKAINETIFRYRLKNFEADYGPWTNSPLKEYNNLSAGEYEFMIQTKNHRGDLVEANPIIVHVEPPFYKTLYAKIIFALVFILLIYFGYHLQRRYYKSKTKRIKIDNQAQINQKQLELRNLKEEKVQAELRHVNNLLAASTMNLVVKNEFMENIKRSLKQVTANGIQEKTKKELNRLVKDIDSTLKVQKDWEQFEYHFDKVHGDFLNRLTHEFTDLTPGEQKLCAFLRLKMDTKDIANLMGISLRGVEVARYRLRKKLDLKKQQNLSKFILEY